MAPRLLQGATRGFQDRVENTFLRQQACPARARATSGAARSTAMPSSQPMTAARSGSAPRAGLPSITCRRATRSAWSCAGSASRSGAANPSACSGPNGAGKTTVFYMITGLVPADAGNITIDGRDVTRLPMYRRARLGIGYLPQEASIFRGLTVEQNIMAVLELVEPIGQEAPRASSTACSRSSASPTCANRRPSPCRAASGGAARSPGPWPPGPRSCCSTSHSPASIPSPSAISRSSCGI